MNGWPQDDLDLLLTAAAAAGRLAKSYFRQAPKVWWKEGNSPVSEADLAVDAYLKKTLLDARPGYGWLSEETEASPVPTEEPERFFVIDPIDGTRSFLRGEDTWCVSLAVIAGGHPVAGVVDAPIREEVFRAVAGDGAMLNDRKLDLSEGVADGMLRVAMPDGMRRRLDARTADSLRMVASAPSLAYRIAQVAAGHLDGTLIRPHANDWDIAASDLILAEAGGRLDDIDGEERLYKLEGRRHGLLIAGATAAWPRLQAIARSAIAA